MDLILTAIGVVAAILGCNFALYSWLRSDIKSFETEIRGWKNEINAEMRDFHVKLALQDQEFKLRNSFSEGAFSTGCGAKTFNKGTIKIGGLPEGKEVK